MTLTTQIRTALTQFTATSRLYALTIDDEVTVDRDALLVEAFFANDEVHGVGVRDVIAVSMNASIPLEQMLNKKAVLEVSMANGQRTRFTGEVSEAAMLGSDGGFARYRLRLSPWLWRLGLVRNCRVWQDTTMIDIVDSVFKSYLPMARWRWSDEVTSFMLDAMPRRYCCQYRESDLDFVRRVLTEEGLGWRFE